MKQSTLTACMVITSLLLPGLKMMSQDVRSWRGSFPEPDATIRESLLTAVFPGARFKWAPDLKLQNANGSSQAVYFSGFKFVPGNDGNFNGATGLDIGNAKRDFLFKSRNFHSHSKSRFSVDLIVFRATPTGQLITYKKFSLDPSDPLAKIKSIDVDKWPLLRIEYESHSATLSSFTTIEWDSLFDRSSGNFVSRRPRGIERTFKDGREEIHMFSISRVSPGQIQIADVLNKRSVQYKCAEPCVIDGPTLLTQWP